jgi:hypothetical protein
MIHLVFIIEEWRWTWKRICSRENPVPHVEKVRCCREIREDETENERERRQKTLKKKIHFFIFKKKCAVKFLLDVPKCYMLGLCPKKTFSFCSLKKIIRWSRS